MERKDAIRLTSRRFSDFSTKIEQKDRTFYILTELSGSEPVTVRTTVYLEGAHIETIKTTTAERDEPRLTALMEAQHKGAIRRVQRGETASKAKVAYFREIKRLIKRGDLPQALDVVRRAQDEFPDDPFLSSYYGYLLATVESGHEEGVRICREALKKLERFEPFGSEFLYPVFYLNLGRTYLAAGSKTEAIQNFRKGLSYDPENQEIISELQRLGTRKRPIIPVLQRSNPVNKYLGLFFARLSGRTSG